MKNIGNWMRLSMNGLVSACVLCLGASVMKPVYALDLTASGSSDFVNDGVFFQQTNSTGAGSGSISPFLRIQAGPSEEGYNTDARPVDFDEITTANFTRNLLAAEIPVVTINGIRYGEFLLDINQSQGGSNSLIDLTELLIFQHGISDITNGETSNEFNEFAGQSVTKIFDLNEVVNLNDLESGSGSIDYTINVPEILFDLSNGKFVTLYAEFNSSNSGFEEFAVAVGDDLETIPTPALLPGLVGMGVAAFRKRKRQAQVQ